MASLFRPSYTHTDKKTGKKSLRKAKKWYGQYTDADSVLHRVPLSANKTVAQQMLNELVKKAELGKVGIVDPFEAHRKRSLADHLADYEASLRAKGTSAKQIGQVTSRIRRVLTGCRFTFLADLSASRVQTFLADLRQKDKALSQLESGKLWHTKTELAAAIAVRPSSVNALVRRHRLKADGKGKARRFPQATAEFLLEHLTRDRGIQTINFYLAAVKQFLNWMVKDRRTSDNLLAHLSGGNVKLDRRHDRRPLALDELTRLLETTRTSDREFRGLVGPERHMLYVVACVTGFRRAELAILTPASFDLDADTPTATMQAGYTNTGNRPFSPFPLTRPRP
jgi:hypothetical protein